MFSGCDGGGYVFVLFTRLNVLQKRLCGSEKHDDFVKLWWGMFGWNGVFLVSL